ncbi:ATP-binding protein, partial [Rhodoferax sp.]|uniref:ATP-binding protein n=1 Tax=Rhodoferax sp. TaxID=50421 RepID=UPI0025F46DF1
PSVEQHLFEPFFSSESRSSGLGLYICRELCDSHGAEINYQRSARAMGGQMFTGNEFFVTFKTLPPHDMQPAPAKPNE